MQATPVVMNATAFADCSNDDENFAVMKHQLNAEVLEIADIV